MQEAIASLAATKEISLDAAVAALLSELDGILMLKEEQRTTLRAFLVGKKNKKMKQSCAANVTPRTNKKPRDSAACLSCQHQIWLEWMGQTEGSSNHLFLMGLLFPNKFYELFPGGNVGQAQYIWETFHLMCQVRVEQQRKEKKAFTFGNDVMVSFTKYLITRVLISLLYKYPLNTISHVTVI